ncbi:MAG TPA: deoxyribodipyrimidine photo-lyase, partial [Tepidisphaeraceae bacterium]|nr:deoxyribodipyrimidine photo-lyase [Tepidisphaeraceae bacterium]
ERHYAFLLQGLHDVHRALRDRGIRFVIRHGMSAEIALTLSADAAMVVCDRGYTRHQRAWREQVAREAGVRVVEVESDVVVPVNTASPKLEIGARTLRPKIHRLWDEYLRDHRPIEAKHDSTGMKLESDFDIARPSAVLEQLKLDRSVKPVEMFVGGELEAARRLREFVDHKLDGYAEGRNEPAAGQTTTLSPYLHFGHISPIRIALAVQRKPGVRAADREALLEELIVRRELSMNLVLYNNKYDQYAGTPEWARHTLAQHADDERPTIYTDAQLESAQTHDPYWNAAQLQMNLTGFMHNYMRMYWGKKILEWSRSPRQGFERTLRINNKYFIDGRDPNSFCGVQWIYGTHDRPWGPKRSIFGAIRYMNDKGLERKFEIDRYVQQMDDLRRSLRD